MNPALLIMILLSQLSKHSPLFFFRPFSVSLTDLLVMDNSFIHSPNKFQVTFTGLEYGFVKQCLSEMSPHELLDMLQERGIEAAYNPKGQEREH